MDSSSRQLILHGAIVLLYGLLCGAPYGRSINRGAPQRTVDAWRLAHSSLAIGAILMLIVAMVLPVLVVAPAVKWTIALALIVSSYSFCISLTLGPIVGHRGLASGGPLSARLVYLGNLAGAGGSLIGALGLLWGATVSL